MLSPDISVLIFSLSSRVCEGIKFIGKKTAGYGGDIEEKNLGHSYVCSTFVETFGVKGAKIQ